jgi:hypothetical protein
MVHPITDKTISSYKKLMDNPATIEVWQTAFGKDFGGMAQGCNKTGQKGTNAMFVMTIAEIASAIAAGKKSLTQIRLLIPTHKRKTLTDSKSRLEETSYNVNRSYPSAQRTLTQQNCIGTVWKHR